MRAIGTGLATCWLRLASMVGPFVVGLVVTRSGTDSVFLMLSLIAIVGVFAATRMTETRGRRLEEIARLMLHCEQSPCNAAENAGARQFLR